ncbi:hypothetical protein [Alteromonas macleodii]|uniref:Uncharacterized protein n=1 Tax=Alteromonas macleodii TaxID=28108 RepID=A0AB36FKS3_ALTMA|nr:hypothetical protein [Alteromonas macleodii]OES24131.1 hypothetical protein BFV93_4731 [Alteromonas macleodii]OES24765.1 hypothetical protein BFV95_4524 [Alteromonas macleodii]OES25043.1 hypothetical protein BFV94_4514 [Alteromonas macleodii]OES39086.1 hypothetical protein BFV96_4234 [Alteromonas macleodii]
MPWKYVENEFDTYYLKALPDVSHLTENSLPPSEFEVRQMLFIWLREGFIPFNSFDVLDKTFANEKYQHAKKVLSHYSDLLLNLTSSPAHGAALMRVVSKMPDHVPQKAYLLNDFLKQQTPWPLTELVLSELQNMGIKPAYCDHRELGDRKGRDRLFFHHTPACEASEGMCLAITHWQGKYSYSVETCNRTDDWVTGDSESGFDTIPLHARKLAQIYAKLHRDSMEKAACN